MAVTARKGRGARGRSGKNWSSGKGAVAGGVGASHGNIQDFLGSRNEAAARDITDLSLKRGQHAAVRELGSGWDALNKGYAGAQGTIRDTTNRGLGYLKAGQVQGRGDITGARDAAIAATRTGETGALSRLLNSENRAVGTLGATETAGLQRLLNSENRATGTLRGAETSALSEYDPYLPGVTRGAQTYSAALGLGTPAERQQAVEAFQAGPGYEWQMDQGLGQLERRAAARGMLGSGNTSLDTMTYAQGLANQEYQTWLDRLRGQQDTGVGIAGARSGIETATGENIGNLQMQGGVNRAGLIERTGGAQAALQAAGGVNRAGVVERAGTQEADIRGQAGSNLANIDTRTGENLASTIGTEGTNLAGLQTGRGEAAMGYHQDLANLRRATKLAQGSNRAGFQLSRNQTGANQVGLVGGVIQTALSAMPGGGAAPATGTSAGSKLFQFPQLTGGPPTSYQNQYQV